MENINQINYAIDQEHCKNVLREFTNAMKELLDAARDKGKRGLLDLSISNYELMSRALICIHNENLASAANYIAMIWYRQKHVIDVTQVTRSPIIPETSYLRAVTQEYDRAMQLFPGSAHNMNVLTEEVGELAQALLQLQYEPKKGKSNSDVLKEAVQVGAVAMKIAIHGDSTFPAFQGMANKGEGV